MITTRSRFFCEQQRQRRDAVEIRHVDVEHDDVGIDALELVDGLAAGAQRGDDFKIGFGFDPARKQPAHDDGVVDEHDADAAADGGGRTIGATATFMGRD